MIPVKNNVLPVSATQHSFVFPPLTHPSSSSPHLQCPFTTWEGGVGGGGEGGECGRNAITYCYRPSVDTRCRSIPMSFHRVSGEGRGEGEGVGMGMWGGRGKVGQLGKMNNGNVVEGSSNVVPVCGREIY